MNKKEINLEDFMQDYQLPEDFPLEGEPLTPEARQRILKRTLAKVAASQTPARAQANPPAQAIPRARATRAKGFPRRRLLVFSLAAVLMLAMSSLALAQFAFNQDFLSFFNTDNSRLPQQSGQEVYSQVTNNGATLTVEQILGDSQSVYVLLDFTAPEGTVLDQDFYQWDQGFVTLSQSGGLGYYFENLPDDNPLDNRIRMMLCLNAATSLKGQQLNLNLADLKSYSVADQDYTTQVEGQWQLSFKLDYNAASQQFKQNTTIKLGEAEVQVKSVEISPLTMILDLEIANPEGFAAPADYTPPQGGGVIIGENELLPMENDEIPLEVQLMDCLGDLERLQVTLKNGEVLATQGGGSNSSDDSHYQIIFSFNQILQLEDIASVSYFGQELSIS